MTVTASRTEFLTVPKRLQSAGSAQEINLNMNWEQAKLYNGAGFIVAYSYTHDLWRLGSGLPATSGDQLKESAGMMFLYTFDLIVADGPKCADLSASTHRRDQLFTQNRPIFDYLRAAPVASKMRMGTVSLSIETATAQVRTKDEVLCSGGLDEMSEGLKAQGAKPLQPVPNAPGTFGKTYAVPPAPGYKPKFVDDKIWRLKQATARQDLPAALIRLLSVSTISQPASTQLTPDRKGYIVYDQCMMHAAIQASHTDAKDDEIFGLARAQCSSTRSAAIQGQENNKQFLAALDAADADKATRFPTWIKGVRERRKASDAKLAAPINAPHP
jgi:hypothetical protein